MIPVLVHPFYSIIMKTFFENLPNDREESAVMEGAGTGTVFAAAPHDTRRVACGVR